AASAQTRIVLDVDAAAVVKRAYRQGPIEAPTVTHLPCKARPDAPLTIVEAVIDENGKVVQATVVAGAHGPIVDSAVKSCLGKARLSPARMNGRPVAVIFNMALSGRS
ncbi:MAG TPA: energy transducer TonB, partial [Thermoanaerobaculia bacterium]